MRKAILSVDGLVGRPYHFDKDELLGMEQVEAIDLLHACGTGEPKGNIERCRGVLLTDLINLVDVRVTGHDDTKKMYLVASSDDGYSTVFSWQELFNSPVGEGVMIVLEQDGESVDEKGYVDLISTRDYLTGPRHVKRLAHISVLKVD